MHRVLRAHLRTFLTRAEGAAGERLLPRFLVREFADLKCGVLAHGFGRVHCRQCGKDELVAFSCKRRGLCPSCGARPWPTWRASCSSR